MSPGTLIKMGAGIVVMTACTWFVVSHWRDRVVERQRERAAQIVESLVTEGRWLEARGAVREFWRTFGEGLPSAEEAQWRSWDIVTSEKTGDLARLVWLEAGYPDRMQQNESASLLVARTLAAAGQSEEADRLRAAWSGREQHPEWWYYWEIDQHLAAGRREEALLMLEERQFDGEADAGRRLRLAFLAPDPQTAWDELQAAVELEPRNADARSFRGQLLERAGHPSHARVEYVSALVADPQDVVRRDQLAQFYLRQRSVSQALQTWRDGLTPSAPDFLWLRIILWEKLQGSSADPLPEPGLGAWTELIRTMQAVPKDLFWEFDVVMDPVMMRRAAARPEVELLKVLEHLRRGQQMEALEQLTTLSDGARALDPVAVGALKAVLRWRVLELEPEFGFLPPVAPGVVEHDIMNQIRGWAAQGLAPETAAVLAGPEAWTTLMLAVGWPQAAVIMGGNRAVNPALPGWYHYGMAVSLHQCRGLEAARQYLEAVPQEPVLQLLQAELIWPTDPEGARQQMATLAAIEGEVGYRAAWLLALDALDQGRVAEVVRWIDQQPQLKSSVAGQELQARAALAMGREDQAVAIYRKLGAQSLDAGMWLSRKAFAAEDWDLARSLTLELMDRFPAQVELRRNLEHIDEAVGGAVPTP